VGRELILFSVTVSLAFLAFVIYLSQRRKLSEQYAVFWVMATVGMLVLAANPGLLDSLAGWFEVEYPPSLLFLFALLASFGLLLHLSTVISRQERQIREMAQALALMENQLAELRKGDEGDD